MNLIYPIHATARAWIGSGPGWAPSLSSRLLDSSISSLVLIAISKGRRGPRSGPEPRTSGEGGEEMSGEGKEGRRDEGRGEEGDERKRPSTLRRRDLTRLCSELRRTADER